MKISIGNDHAGPDYKSNSKMLDAKGYEVTIMEQILKRA
jgi:ribose 5-phosphate isomerase RpiB